MFQTQARRAVLGVRQASAARILLAGKVPVSGLTRPFPCAPASASIHTTPHVGSQKKAHPRSSEEEDEDEYVINGKAGEGEVLDEAALREALDQGEISFDEIEEFENEMGFEDDEDINDPEAMFRAGVTEPQRIGETEAELFGSDVSEVSHKPREGLDPRQLPIVINSLADLGPNFTEEAYASALIHGRSIHKPFVHPTTMHIPVCSIQFLSYHPRLLTLFTHFAMHAASALGIPTSRGVVMLPTERRLWTVPRSPFVHKKSQENFERRTHKRMIKAWDADGEVVERWLRYLRKHEMGGVGMRVTRWDRMPIGIGRTRMENVERALSAPGLPGSGEEAEGDPDVRLAEVREEIDSSANRKKAILALGQKIVKEEKMASQGQGIVIDVKTDVKDESQSKKA